VATKGINFICKVDELLYYDIIENGTVEPGYFGGRWPCIDEIDNTRNNECS
jgi:hypothetical protein